MQKLKKYKFWFHYNKPASRTAGEPRLTVHFRDQCYLVNKVCCYGIDIVTRNNKKQPHCVVAGNATDLVIKNDVADIY